MSIVDQIAIEICVEAAGDGSMACAEEYECTAPDHCGHYREALSIVAEMQRRQDIWSDDLWVAWRRASEGAPKAHDLLPAANP